MPDVKRKNLSVLNEVHDKASVRYKKEFKANQTNLSFIKWFSEYVLLNLEKDEYMARYAPHLESVGITDNRLTIRDNKKDKLTDIFLKDGHFYCNLDEVDNCEHIQFALALPELVRLKNKN